MGWGGGRGAVAVVVIVAEEKLRQILSGASDRDTETWRTFRAHAYTRSEQSRLSSKFVFAVYLCKGGCGAGWRG